MKYFLRFLKNVFLFLFKQIVGTIISISIIIFLIAALIMGTIESEVETKPIIEKDSYVYLNFSNGIQEKLNFSWKNLNLDPELSFYNFIRTLDEIKNDNNISGLIIDLDSVQLSGSQIEEIGIKLDEIKKSNKKIYAFANYLNRSNYLLGLYADEIYMTPSFSTSVSLEGYKMEVPYFKSLTEKLGLEFQVIHIGDFKSYGENFVKNKMSTEFRENYTRLLDASLNDFLDKVSYRRKIGKDLFEDKLLKGNYLMMDSKSAKVEGLIDGLAFYDDFLEEKNIENTISIEEYFSGKNKFVVEGDKIGLIVASGEIRMNSGDADYNYITPYELSSQIDEAIDDDSVKGVVLRVDSPGGSALASEIIVNKLKKLNNKKPVYVSMGSVAASGGYYISSNASKIFANKKTITGSIGVVSMIFNLEKLYEKMGLKWETIEKGKTFQLGNLNKKLTEEEIELIRSSSKKTYDEFKTRVIEGRNINANKLEEIAQGKVWTGAEAQKLGLVDQIGTLEDTIKTMGNDLGLLNYEVTNLQMIKSKWDMFFEFKNFLESKVKLNILGENISKVEEELEHYQETNGEVQYLLPYDISIN